MVKRFHFGGSVVGNIDKTDSSKELLIYIHTLECDGWVILDVKEITGILPWDFRRKYVEYKITCSKPDPEI